eukprot:86036-Prymnesium_polylepis.2
MYRRVSSRYDSVVGDALSCLRVGSGVKRQIPHAAQLTRELCSRAPDCALPQRLEAKVEPKEGDAHKDGHNCACLPCIPSQYNFSRTQPVSVNLRHISSGSQRNAHPRTDL